MILPFTFDKEKHIYSTPGHYTLSTSDIIDLAGLSDMSMIPVDVLRHACHRGTVLHKAVEDYEMGFDWQEAFDHDYMPYLQGYFAFRDQYDIKVLPPMEKQYCYLHEGTGQAVGATIDMRFLYDGDLYIGDLKSIHPLSGKALKQKQLAWRLQTQSYVEATEMDEKFVKAMPFGALRRCVIHIHPKLKGGFSVFRPESDDALLWDGAVRLAMEKVSVGMMPLKKPKAEMPLREQLRRSVEAEDASMYLTDDDLPASWGSVLI